MSKLSKKNLVLILIFACYPLFDFYLSNSNDFFFRSNHFFILFLFIFLFFLFISFLIIKFNFNLNFFYIFFFIFFSFFIYKDLVKYYFPNIQFYFFFIIYLILLLLIPLIFKKLKKINIPVFLTIFVYLNILFISINENSFSFIDSDKNSNENLKNETILYNKKPIYKPDIFYIMPDYFIGNPYLLDKFNYNYVIEKQLDKLGFETINNSYSNGSSTFMSISHLFESDYFMKDKMKLDNRLKNKLYKLWENTEFYNFLKYNNYNFNIVSSNNYFCDYENDNCFSNNDNFFNFVVTFLRKTPLIYIADKLIQINLLSPIFDTNYPEFDFLNNFNEYTSFENPSFYYIHSYLAYGRPFRDAKCNKSNDRIYINEDIKQKYIENYKCVEKILYDLVELIINKFNDEAIIIIQSDHGTFFANQGKAKFENLTTDNIYETFQNFTSFKLPVYCSNLNNIQSLTQVNVFPLLYNCMTQSNIKFKPDKYFWGFHNSDYIIEIKNLY